MHLSKQIPELRKLREVRSFPGGKHSARVVLLEQQVVAKYHTLKQKSFFDREKEILTQLTGCPFTPQLLGTHEDPESDEFVLYMTYCGEQVPFYDSAVRKRVRSLVKELSKRWRIGRRWFASALPKRHNVTLLDGNLKLIDFNSGQWIIKSKLKPLPATLPAFVKGGQSI